MHRPTWVEIDLNAVSNNLKNIKSKVGHKTKIIAIVKANAYGHGIEKVSKRLACEGIDMFGVATVEDAIKLRKSGINCPILMLGCILPNQIETVVRYSVTPTIVNYSIAKQVSDHASKILTGSDNLRNKVNVHVKIDTGMGGFGIKSENAEDTVKRIKELKNINIDGIFTHFTSPDGSDKSAVREQLDLFNNVIRKLEGINIFIPLKHTDNSSMVIQNPLSYNAIRPGIAIYGLYPSKKVPRTIGLQQIMSFKTSIVNIKKLNPGDHVSYDRTYEVSRESLIATLPVGYSDGYRRELSNKGVVLVRGKRAPVVGLVRMDFTYIDVTDIPDVAISDNVVLFGKQGDETITIESIAEYAGALPYEIACGISNNVPRLYINE